LKAKKKYDKHRKRQKKKKKESREKTGHQKTKKTAMGVGGGTGSDLPVKAVSTGGRQNKESRAQKQKSTCFQRREKKRAQRGSADQGFQGEGLTKDRTQGYKQR